MPVDWDAEAEALYWLLLPELTAAAQLGGKAAVLELARQGIPAIGIDWAMANEDAAAWAAEYAYDLVRQLNDTTRDTLQAALEAWQRTPGMNRGQLERLILDGAEGIPDLQLPSGRIIPARQRAEWIAQTESTRSAAQGSLMAIRSTGIQHVEPDPHKMPSLHTGCRCAIEWRPDAEGTLRPFFFSVADERVCPRCGPLHGTDISLK